MNTTSVEITAGLGGFLVLFALALAVWFLGRDLTRRLRRMDRAEELRRQAEAPVDDPVEAGAEADGAEQESGTVEKEDRPDSPGAVTADPAGEQEQPDTRG